jgi:hypothetical protein
MASHVLGKRLLLRLGLVVSSSMVTSSHSRGGGASVASTFATTFASLHSIREALGFMGADRSSSSR